MLLKEKKKKKNVEPTFCVVNYVVKITSLVIQDSEGEVKLQGLQKSLSEFRQPKITHK